MPEASRAQLIHIETDRRLGHEWDEWDGRALPNGGDFSALPGLFFRYAALTICAGFAALAGVLYLLAPRLTLVAAALPVILAWALAAGVAVASVWFGVLLLSFYGGVALLPEGLLERRPRAVVAVACERDMMTGLRDVAGKLPVLGLTMQLPNGPCRDAVLELAVMDRWVRSLVGA